MDAASGAVAGGVVAVALGAFRLIEAVLVKRSVKAGNGTLSANAKAAAENSGRNLEILSRTDDDGVPRVYQPAWVGKLLRQHHEQSRDLAEISRRQTALLEQLAAGLQAHWDREEKELVGIKEVLRDFRG